MDPKMPTAIYYFPEIMTYHVKFDDGTSSTITQESMMSWSFYNEFGNFKATDFPPIAEVTYDGAPAKVDSVLLKTIPGLSQRVDCPHPLHKLINRSDVFEKPWPCTGTISWMIIHLNDACSWTREQIADWLDTLDADLNFPVEDE